MKKLIVLIAFLLFTSAASLLLPEAGLAAPPDYNGGVHNEYTYEEYIFVSGTPVKFSGKVTVSERDTATQRTETYRYILTNPSQPKDKLTRSASYVTDISVKTDKGQTTAQTSVKSYSEKITIGSETYELDDYQLSQGTITDNRPASDYYSGNIAGRKIYKLKSSDALVTVHFSGKNVGYENFWGATETQIIDYEIQSSAGTFFVKSTVADSKTRFLQYEPHDPSLSSFTGGYARISEQSMSGEYTYTQPGSVEKTVHVGQEMVPLIERLIVPKFRDLNGHWAKENIEQLYGLGVFDDSSSFFSPGTQMNRYPFIVGVMKAADIRVLEQPKKQTTPKKAIFSDLDPREKDYLYIESAMAKGISKGYSATQFKPNGALTRAEAVAILVRALGLEHRAPDPGYHTGYVDDSSIPKWAKDSAYVATEIGLVYGDLNNRFNPTKTMTRAEASALTIRFLHFLEKDLKQNYRDDMLFFNN